MVLFAALVLASLAPAQGAPFTFDSRNLFESDLLSLDVDANLRGSAGRFSQVAVFGDSLSDGGCALSTRCPCSRIVDEILSFLDQERRVAVQQQDLAGGPACARKFPESQSTAQLTQKLQYYGHRFSNGRVHAEDLASSLGLPILDFGASPHARLASHRLPCAPDAAIGGATTNNTLVAGYTGPGSTLGPVPSVLDQVRSFTRSPSLAAKAHSTLFIVYGGANNFFFDPSVTASDVLRDLQSAVKALRAVGAPSLLRGRPSRLIHPLFRRHQLSSSFPSPTRARIPLHDPRPVVRRAARQLLGDAARPAPGLGGGGPPRALAGLLHALFAHLREAGQVRVRRGEARRELLEGR